ncbi:hypothetical protein [Vibrio maritimus]|uniref:hypothetical protein n=1 Tax=Vibrio maritimus TaxID=990268 RepID=UPI001F42D383|nr:hypothetical protein [Vibrio maritimus]
MDDLQFYLVNEYCPRCNSVTTHDVFEVNTDNDEQNSQTEVEHFCEKCQSLDI